MELVNIALPQLSMKSGLHKYKSEGNTVAKKGFLQLHMKEAFVRLKSEDMMEEQNRPRYKC